VRRARSADHRWLAYGALLITILGISWSAIFIRWAAVPGASSGFYRVSIAAAVLVPWWIVSTILRPERRRKLAEADRRSLLLALAGGAFFACDIALYNTAVLRTSATTATLLGNNAPIFVGLGTWLLFRRRPGRTFWAGLVLAMTGAAIVMLGNAGSRGSGSGDLTADLFAVGAAVFFAGYILTTGRARETLDTLTFSTVAIAGSVATLLVVCLVVDAPLGGFSFRTWAALAGLGLISQLASYFALAYALGHLPATVTSVGLLAQVPLTALLAAPFLGERLGATQALGAALVLAGIYTVGRRQDSAS
jgi:drug/metabolite transporter (DMT)-like permease